MATDRSTWDASRDEIRERGNAVCRRLSDDVAKLAPEGIGRWDGAWDIVAGADADFLAALTAWESDPSEETKARVKHAYAAVIESWKRAVEEYERERASR